jgi:plastocyanin
MPVPRRTAARVAGIVSLVFAVSCGSSPAAPSGGGSSGTNANTITITASGVSPKTMQITLGSRVRFLNSDSRPHNMASDPHPEHTDCPEFDQVGFLTPGQARETGNLVTVRTCGFHDHDNPDNAGLKGSVTIR